MASALKQDVELKEMLGQLEFIKTGRTFRRWKTSFLTRWEEFLEQENIEHADDAYQKFAKNMSKFVILVDAVNKHVANNDLTAHRTTVKGRNSLNEMNKNLTLIIDQHDALIPQTNQLEKKCGYNKFHMGAILIRDNFKEYGRLSDCRDTLQHMRTVSLNDVADKQILEEMDNFATILQKFCDVMADLGLFEVMLKCREFDVVEEGPNLDNLLFIDIKTLSFGELSREDCLFQKVLTPRGVDETGNTLFAEIPTDDAAKDKLFKVVQDHPKLGFGSGKANNTYNRDEVGISEMEKVQNMWGVKLKKTPKNIKGEELIFIDQRTCAYGELSRILCLERGLLTETKDENTRKTVLAESHTDLDDKAEIMERIRSLMKLGIEKKE